MIAERQIRTTEVIPFQQFRSDAPASVERVVKREPEEEREIGVQDHTQDCTLEPLVSDEIDVKTEPLSPSM
jgi:hypothetical protein